MLYLYFLYIYLLFIFLSAIDVVLDMKNQNFKPQKNTLVSIRNSIFTSSIKDADW